MNTPNEVLSIVQIPSKFYRFRSRMVDRGPACGSWDERDIKNEPMLFSCDHDSAFQLGGPITRAILSALPADWKNRPAIIDSRVHMLMPGWYPCIPGYHHDDVPRNRIDGQPDYDDPAYHAEHLMVLVNGDIAPTDFAIGDADFPTVPVGGKCYREWHPLVERYTTSGILERASAPSMVFLQFDAHTWHQGVRAVAGGWRYFIRLSRNTARTANPANEVRRQVQVYLETPMEGW